jgi:hypothetical protein
MHFRLAALAIVLCSGSFGCATPEEPAASAGAPATATASQPRNSGSYRTGSRLPSYDDEPAGASTVGGASKDDYADEARRTISPIRGQ